VNARVVAAATWTEALWWARRLFGVCRRYPGSVVVAAAAGWLLLPFTPLWLLAALLVAVVGLRAWARLAPVDFHRIVAGPMARRYRCRRMRRRWPELAVACGLGIQPAPRRGPHPVRDNDVLPAPAVPKLVRVTTEGPRVRLRIRPLVGQTFDDIEKVAERLRTAVGATRVRTDPLGPNEAVLTLTMGDALAAPFTVPLPSNASRPSNPGPLMDGVRMGRVEDGSTWMLPLGPHTLVAGCSGSGKGSVFWSFAFALAPAVRAGLVRLHGVDLKGGMEILMGAGLFTKRATNAAEAVVLLEALVTDMRERTRAYAGRVRSHTATLDEPLHVVMIDELAALTAYCPERDLQRRAEMAINLLCSQGRAPGFVVFACLQDPRKEVIPSRGLFTQMVGLRLKDVSETAMVLGEAAVTSGALCHRITPATPGMGYVVPEDGGFPIRVRTGYVSDHAVQSVAAEFATPIQEPVVVPEPDPDDQLARVRRGRSAPGTGVS
jgi:S-DNA-T family DNA segregation ATPase FtsK/SpoIIIE